jgi:hypothetical protein
VLTQIGNRTEVINRDDLDILAFPLVYGAQDQPANASKAVYGNPSRHGSPFQIGSLIR